MKRAKYISNGTITYKIVGEQGPQGPQGNVGPQGPQGPTGPQGPEYDDTEIQNKISDITQYSKEYKNVTINTNHDEPIYLESNTRYNGHGTVFKTTSTPKHNIADIMTNPHPALSIMQWKENIIVEGFIFDGDSENVPGDLMTHVIMLGLFQCQNVIIRNCIFRNSNGAYIVCNTCKDILIENCFFYGGDSCINGSDSSEKENITIRNCFFDGKVGDKYTISEPITMVNIKNFKVESNYVSNKKGTCCAIAVKSDYVKFINNTFRNSGTFLCGVRECTNSEIDSNILYGEDFENCYHGICVCDSECIVTNNKVYDVRMSSILLTSKEFLGESTHTVENNVLVRNNIIENKINTSVWSTPIRIEGWGNFNIVRNDIYKYVSNHFECVSLYDFDNTTEEQLECNVSVIDNLFDSSKDVVGFSNTILSRKDIKINLDVRYNKGKAVYNILKSNGFEYTIFNEEVVSSTN